MKGRRIEPGSGGVPFCSVAEQTQVRGALAVWRRLGWVLGVVKDVHLCVDGLGRYEEGVLRHVPRPIDLALMIYLLGDLQCGCVMALKQASGGFDIRSHCSCPIVVAHSKGLAASRRSEIPVIMLAVLLKLKCWWSEGSTESIRYSHCL